MLEHENIPPESETRARKMSRLAIVRHGEYGPNLRLNESGRQQIQQLGERLAQNLDREKELALILSSTAPRAVDSAHILSGILAAPIEEYEELWSERGRRYDLEWAYQLVTEAGARAHLLVIMTHEEYTTRLPSFIGNQDLGKNYLRRLEKGQGVTLDYTHRSITQI